DCARNCHANLGGQRVIEKFVVGAPPERIIHYRRSGQCGVLKPGAIERDVLRYPIDHHVVTTRLALDHFVDPDELRGNLFAACLLVYPLDERRRKTVFLSKKNSDFFHSKLNRGFRGLHGQPQNRKLEQRGLPAISLTPDFSPVITATRGNKAVSTALSRQGV